MSKRRLRCSNPLSQTRGTPPLPVDPDCGEVHGRRPPLPPATQPGAGPIGTASVTTRPEREAVQAWAPRTPFPPRVHKRAHFVCHGQVRAWRVAGRDECAAAPLCDTERKGVPNCQSRGCCDGSRSPQSASAQAMARNTDAMAGDAPPTTTTAVAQRGRPRDKPTAEPPTPTASTRHRVPRTRGTAANPTRRGRAHQTFRWHRHLEQGGSLADVPYAHWGRRSRRQWRRMVATTVLWAARTGRLNLHMRELALPL